jgi:hypothetical protein
MADRVNRKPVSEHWLRAKYVDEGLTCVDIGKLVRRDPKSVHSWLRAYGIPTRGRGTYAPAHFKKGEPSAFAGRRHSDEVKQILSDLRRADGHFPKDRDQPYWKGKSGSAHPTWNGGSTPERQVFYGSESWGLARTAVYTRDKGMCRKCGEDCRKVGGHLHHIVPFAVTALRAQTNNLVLLCPSCHRYVHSLANVDREFLPDFGVLYRTQNGQTDKILISYRPKHNGSLPLWMR